ncbi:MAG: hypothetical protein RL268_2098, partial [Pseudomonadota bacterium]
MKRMLVICPFPVGCAAQQRLKYEQYFDDWRTAGWTIDVSPFLDRGAWDILYTSGHTAGKVLGTLKGYLRRLKDLSRIANYDLVYICMWATPFGGPLFERLIRRRAKALVYDIEDNVLESSEGQAEHPNPLARLLKRQSKFLYLIRTADHVIDIGPGAGIHGGNVIVSDYLPKLLGAPTNPSKSVTLDYLRGDKKIAVPARRESEKGAIKIRGGKAFNIKNLNVDIPLGRLICVTGVSGSGKSTFMYEIVDKNLKSRLEKK